MTTINKHGLKRTIPSDIKLKVRKECGFGCVICGSWIYEYEHFNPEFKDATFHDPNGIALLCCTHHGAKTKGLLTNDQVSSYRAHPYNIKNGIKNKDNIGLVSVIFLFFISPTAHKKTKKCPPPPLRQCS